MKTVKLSLSLSDYNIFDDVSVIGVTLTERDAALVASFLFLARDRAIYEPISDADWNFLEYRLSALIERFT